MNAKHVEVSFELDKIQGDPGGFSIDQVSAYEQSGLRYFDLDPLSLLKRPGTHRLGGIRHALVTVQDILYRVVTVRPP